MNKEVFYIDSQFDLPIFIDVEDGIVKSIRNAPIKWNGKISEWYVNKSISHLKADFEKRMSPVFYKVHPEKLSFLIKVIRDYQTKISGVMSVINSRHTPKDNIPLLKETLKEYKRIASIKMNKYHKIVRKLKEVHGYDAKYRI